LDGFRIFLVAYIWHKTAVGGVASKRELELELGGREANTAGEIPQ